jgi:hydrogenase large subunit
MASVRCLDKAFGYTSYDNIGATSASIPSQGRILRNIVEGADLVMSHILHFYHLAALDYINTDVAGSIISGQSPWADSRVQLTGPACFGDTGVTLPGLTESATVNTLVTHYVVALNIRRKCHELAAYISGKHPNQPSFLPGGITATPDGNAVTAMQTLLGTSPSQAASGSEIRSFIDNVYLNDILAAAHQLSGELLVENVSAGAGAGCKKYLAYGTFPNSSAPIGGPFNSVSDGLIIGGVLDATNAAYANWTVSSIQPGRIREYIKYSHYDDGGGAAADYDGLNPLNGVTKVDYRKAVPGGTPSASYSWAKAPRYISGPASAEVVNVCEVGPLARMLVNFKQGNPTVQTYVNVLISALDLQALGASAVAPLLRSVLGRHACRMLEAKMVADSMATWLGQVNVTASAQTYMHRNIPSQAATGAGFTEAPRGALTHWIRIDGKKVSNYQCVVPTTWNVSPKDTPNDAHGPIETAMLSTDVSNGAGDYLKLTRIIRSFDPCIACTVHVVSPDKKEVSKFEVSTAASPLCNIK